MQNKMTKKTVKAGFTITEVSIAMAFVAVLLISIAVITTNIISIYQKGMALKSVNSVGRSLTDDFTNALATSPPMEPAALCGNYANNNDKCLQNEGQKYIFNARYDGEQQLGGVFCTGRYSYVWNTHRSDESNKKISLKYRKTNNNVATVSNFRLLKIEDSSYRVCAASIDSSAYTNISHWDSGSPTLDISNLVNSDRPNPISDPTSNLLQAFDMDLWLYELTIFPPTEATVSARSFISGTFVLATGRGVNKDSITSGGDYCKVKGEALDSLSSEFNYCALNKFNFAARTSGV